MNPLLPPTPRRAADPAGGASVVVGAPGGAALPTPSPVGDDPAAAGSPALELDGLTHRFGERVAVAALTLAVGRGEMLALLGPNGSGKSTTFRVVSTLAAPQEGTVRVFGHDVRRAPDVVRRHLGVVFQSPSLDGKLTVRENLHHQGRLYGLGGEALRGRIAELLERFRLADRAGERVDRLSGGLRRRAEVAKALLHRPRLLLLDEPSTGLDPGARRDLWDALGDLRRRDGVTVVVTTHLMDEAERCDRVALMDQGRLVALAAPNALKAEIGGDILTIHPAATTTADAVVAAIGERLGHAAQRVGNVVQLEIAEGHRVVPQLIEALPGQIEQVALGKPTLEDVFLARTGHRLVEREVEGEGAAGGATGVGAGKKGRGRGGARGH